MRLSLPFELTNPHEIDSSGFYQKHCSENMGCYTLFAE
jgi:hypothetical protein